MHSGKNPHPPHERSSEIPRGRGRVLKVKLSEEKDEAACKLEFPRGEGCKTINSLWGSRVGTV